MIEIEVKSKRGFIYDKSSSEILNRFEYKMEKSEEISGNIVQSFTVGKYEENSSSSIDLLKFNDLKCIHGHLIKFESINRLPQDGWQELIDCWSCHDHEFKNMLNLKIKPREKGLLVSNFYLILNKNIIPDCCNSKNKFFYNEINSGFNDNALVYKFFEEFFGMKNSIILKIKNKKYEIKLFYECILIREKAESAFKVGFKETDKPNDDDSFIGDYFKNKIFEILQKNSIKIFLLEYELSFIVNTDV